jgi:hypothetical protein
MDDPGKRRDGSLCWAECSDTRLPPRRPRNDHSHGASVAAVRMDSMPKPDLSRLQVVARLSTSFTLGIHSAASFETAGWSCTCVSKVVALNVLHQASDATPGHSERQIAVQASVLYRNHDSEPVSHVR